MLSYSDAFGERVKAIMQETGTSPNIIEQLSERRVSHMTIRRMAKGYVPNSDHIIEFAEAVGRKKEWSTQEKKRLADELLAEVNSRARYYASVRQGLRGPLEVCPAGASA
jgi:hypothetical protein